jgi:predicted small secreted protein
MRSAALPIVIVCACALLAGCGGGGRSGYDVRTVERAFADARLPLATRADGGRVVSLRLDRPLVRQRGNTVWLRRWDVSVYVYDGDVTSRALDRLRHNKVRHVVLRRRNVVAFVQRPKGALANRVRAALAQLG